jgi:hypothetical protein
MLLLRFIGPAELAGDVDRLVAIDVLHCRVHVGEVETLRDDLGGLLRWVLLDGVLHVGLLADIVAGNLAEHGGLGDIMRIAEDFLRLVVRHVSDLV